MATRKSTGTAKTEPKVRDEASENVFAKEFIVTVDDAENVPEDVIEHNKAAVVQEAEQKGLRATGDVKLESSKALNSRNANLVYTVPVKSATEDK